MERHVYPRIVVNFHYKNPSKSVGLVQSEHDLIEM
jgi:hypothetical protein